MQGHHEKIARVSYYYQKKGMAFFFYYYYYTYKNNKYNNTVASGNYHYDILIQRTLYVYIYCMNNICILFLVLLF